MDDSVLQKMAELAEIENMMARQYWDPPRGGQPRKSSGGRKVTFNWRKAKDMHDEGMTKADIARKLGVTTPAVHYAIQNVHKFSEDLLDNK